MKNMRLFAEKAASLAAYRRDLNDTIETLHFLSEEIDYLDFRDLIEELVDADELLLEKLDSLIKEFESETN